MKEATGELNMTVITIVAIAAIVAFFYFFIYPGLRDSIRLSQACNDPATYRTGDVEGGDEGTLTCREGTTGCTGGTGASCWTCEVNGRTKTCTARQT